MLKLQITMPETAKKGVKNVKLKMLKTIKLWIICSSLRFYKSKKNIINQKKEAESEQMTLCQMYKIKASELCKINKWLMAFLFSEGIKIGAENAFFMMQNQGKSVENQGEDCAKINL